MLFVAEVEGGHDACVDAAKQRAENSAERGDPVQADALRARRTPSLEQAAAWCADWVKLRVASELRANGRLAAIFDIDATLLQNEERGYGWRIEPVCALLRLCVHLGVVVFLVTARVEEGRAFTMEQLAVLRIGGHRELVMRQEGAGSASRQKAAARARIAAEGFAVCLNAGDAAHDHVHAADERVRAVLSPRAAGDAAVFLDAAGAAHLRS